VKEWELKYSRNEEMSMMPGESEMWERKNGAKVMRTWSRTAYASVVGEEKGGGSRVISRYVPSLEGGRFHIEETTQSSLS